MSQLRCAHVRRTFAARAVGVAVVVAIAALGLVAVAPAARTVRVKVAQNATLHRKVLVTSRGHTLYALSAEHGTRFICTDRTCLSLWKPLALPKGATAVGVTGLGKVKRPDGKLQVTYHGHPLYTFTQDRAGDAKGEGFRDVGTWHAVTVGKKPAAKQPAPAPQPQPQPYPGYPTY